ncbi:carboxypeptidase-like regulatory domain-containing protein [Pedobacter panaciterrae]
MKVTRLFLLIPFHFLFANLNAQVIKGTIKNSATQEAVPAVSIHVKNSSEGTYSDDRGRFQLTIKKKLPIILVISSIGFETKEVDVQSTSAALDITINPTSILGQEVVVSASRVVQKSSPLR